MKIDNLHEGAKHVFEVDGFEILLIKASGNIHVIENRCGHFGASLATGKLGVDCISCNHHFAKFSLSDGQVLNDVVEDCDRLKIYEWKIENQQIIVCI